MKTKKFAAQRSVPSKKATVNPIASLAKHQNAAGLHTTADIQPKKNVFASAALATVHRPLADQNAPTVSHFNTNTTRNDSNS